MRVTLVSVTSYSLLICLLFETGNLERVECQHARYSPEVPGDDQPLPEEKKIKSFF